ncbi:calcium-dependent secretion activator 2-like isoform X1 [Papio anubis]|uniref:calcium-dependent secretion activator 2-like isoform X1 n=1 Tax=Papio anubis TaxID=9555 RepID=UPI0012ADB443|nr:calcium-dependent secretion activator 2-like isoform X1 [Papio anubis]
MLDPSSSEEESDEGLEEESRDVLVAAGGSQRAPPAPTREGRRDAPGRAGGGGGAARSVSPSPSVLSEGRDEPERQLDDEQERRIRLQLYVFVVRCIAYPFNAKQPTDMARRQQKLNKQQLQLLKERFQAFLNGETQIVADEAFCNAVRSYYEVSLKSFVFDFLIHFKDFYYFYGFPILKKLAGLTGML